MRFALVALVCAGCSQVFGLDPPTLRAVADGGADAFSGDGPFCYGSSLVHVCFAAPPTGFIAPAVPIDTTATTACDDTLNTNDWCVIAGADVSFRQAINAVGSRPLVVVATGTITVDSMLDVSSHRGAPQGAGSDMPGCSSASALTGTTGGPGGSFGGTGGPGSNGQATAGLPLTVTMLRGGCRGNDGGTSAGTGGYGGGAVYLIASQINVTASGIIDASGEGGSGGLAPNGGGGGGGSGGLVGLEAPMVNVVGQVYANGGGGGQGGGQTISGNAGSDPSAPSLGAQGGNGGASTGGTGGIGSFGITKNGGAGSNGSASAGGGGGGGAAGVVWLQGTLTISSGGSVAPPPT